MGLPHPTPPIAQTVVHKIGKLLYWHASALRSPISKLKSSVVYSNKNLIFSQRTGTAFAVIEKRLTSKMSK